MAIESRTIITTARGMTMAKIRPRLPEEEVLAETRTPTKKKKKKKI